MSCEKIKVEKLDPLTIYSVRRLTDLDEETIIKYYDSKDDDFKASGLERKGGYLTVFYRGNDDFEFGAVIDENSEASEKIRVLDPGLCISISVKGGYDDIPAAHQMIEEYMKENGYVINGNIIEYYKSCEEDKIPESDLETVVIYPVKK